MGRRDAVVGMRMCRRGSVVRCCMTCCVWSVAANIVDTVNMSRMIRRAEPSDSSLPDHVIRGARESQTRRGKIKLAEEARAGGRMMSR